MSPLPFLKPALTRGGNPRVRAGDLSLRDVSIYPPYEHGLAVL
jgi:hypothetical protein